MIAYFTGTPEYHHFTIRKRNGKLRQINAPDENTKANQKTILKYLMKRTRISPCAYGFVPGRSIFDNAQKHVGQPCVMNIDLKDFFPSIKSVRLIQTLKEEFQVKRATVEIGQILTWCTLNGELPQGSPASPWLSNLVAKDMDKALMAYAKTHDMVYTRYADDLTFSGDTDIIYSSLEEIKKIVERCGFIINQKKIKVYKDGRCKQVTGIVVDKRLNVQRDKVNRIRAILHNVEVKVKDNVITDGETLERETGYTYSQLQGFVNFIVQANPCKCMKYQRQLDDLKVVLLR